MTVSTTQNRKEYACNGVTTDFEFPYYFLEDEDLVVLRVTVADGTETLLSLGTDYTVSGAGDSEGGTVTTTSTYSSDYELVIYRDPAVTQGMDLVENDPLPAGELEKAYDRLTMIDQRDREILGRSLRLPEGDTGFDDEDQYLPPKAQRASKFLGFDADGKPVARTGNTGGGTAADYDVGTDPGEVPTNGDLQVDTLDDLRELSSTASTIYVRGHSSTGDGGEGVFRHVSGESVGTYTDNNGTIIVPDDGDGSAAWVRLYSAPVNVLWFGAVGDGSGTDSSDAFQAAIDLGETVFVPDGDYTVSELVVGTQQRVVGEGRSTILRPADDADFCIGFDGLYITLEKVNVDLPDAFSGDGILWQVPGGTNSRYVRLIDVTARQTGSYNANSVVRLNKDNGWTGYNTIERPSFSGGQVTLDGSGTGLNSVLHIQDGAISGAGTFNVLLQRVDGGLISNLDCANAGGDVTLSGTPDRTELAGGMRFVDCARISIDGGWSEGNVGRFEGVSLNHNDISWDEDCEDIVVFNRIRQLGLTYGPWAFWNEEMGANLHIRMWGKQANQMHPPSAMNWVKDPLMESITAGELDEWGHDPAKLVVTRTSSLAPTGFEESTHIKNVSGESLGVFQQLPFSVFRPGTVATLGVWFYMPFGTGENENVSSESHIRVGFSEGTSGANLTTYGFMRIGGLEGFKDRWIYATVTLNIPSHWTQVNAGVAILAEDGELYVAGMTCSPGPDVALFADPLEFG